MIIYSIFISKPNSKLEYFAFQVHFKPGQWVGVQYDEPHGKNDGSVEGKRYFECPAKYGGFMRVTYVTVGDFPEEGFSDDEI